MAVSKEVGYDLDQMEYSVKANYSKRKRLSAYYDGTFRLPSIGMSIPPALRSLQTTINWPRLYVDAIEGRRQLIGFAMGATGQADPLCHEIWHDNNMDEKANQVERESLVQGRAYIVVGRYSEAEPNRPLITVESGAGMAVKRSLRTGEVESAYRYYGWDKNKGRYTYCTRYYTDRIEYYRRSDKSGLWQADTEGGASVQPHDFEMVPVFPLANRPTLDDPDGRTEMADVIPLTDAVARSMTLLQGAQEILAVPQRVYANVKEEDFIDGHGNPIPKWQAYLGAVQAFEDDVKVQQFSAADLRNFTEVMNHYGRLLTSVTGLPGYYIGQSTENPASADAIRASEARLIRTCEQLNTADSPTWRKVMRLCLYIRTGEWSEEARRLQAIWMDPSTPTKNALADAVDKQYRSGLIPKNFARRQMGYTPEEINMMISEEEEDPLASYVTMMQQAEMEKSDAASRVSDEETTGADGADDDPENAGQRGNG